MKCVAVVVLLSLLSRGRSAPLSSCESLIKPITISKDEMLGKWLYIGGSSNLPGSRSLGHLMTSVWLDVTATAESNILSLFQTHRIHGKCSSLIYNVTFENNAMVIEQPFYLKEVYLPTDCADCLVAHEEITSGEDTFTSVMLFSKTNNVSPAALEMFRNQVECFQMPSAIMMNPNAEICPDDISPSEGLSALNSLFEAKMGHRVARILDSLFDMFVN
ncbi:uncharacterized protein LOC119024290 [Acanthopagrus latus]|uniref:uncharacterized protein LOC119024290 n=1 Tax=Acanthopagrus latus TaxID=8177 RepID=UPI00187CBDEE|nr:uncharacterized protein LOC119024290 [Acanthopagrus latus]